MVSTRGTTTTTTPTGQAPEPAPETAAAPAQAGPGGGGGGPGGGPGDGGGDPIGGRPAPVQPGIPGIRMRKGQSLFRSATQNLYSEPSEMFDCDPD